MRSIHHEVEMLNCANNDESEKRFLEISELVEEVSTRYFGRTLTEEVLPPSHYSLICS